MELLHDGKNVREHSSRFFLGGAYGAWLESSDMTDYIVLDFRCTRPQKLHNGKISSPQIGTKLITSVI